MTRRPADTTPHGLRYLVNSDPEFWGLELDPGEDTGQEPTSMDPGYLPTADAA